MNKKKLKKIGSCLLSSVLILNLSIPAALAAPSADGPVKLEYKDTTWKTFKTGSDISFASAWEKYEANQEKKPNLFQQGFANGARMTFNLDGSIPEKTEGYEIKADRDVVIAALLGSTYDSDGIVTVNVDGEFKVANGGKLTFGTNAAMYNADATTEYEFVFNKPITVAENGSLTLQSQGYMQGAVNPPTPTEKYTFANGGKVGLSAGSTLDIASSVQLSTKEEMTESPIQVNGGTVNFDAGFLNGEQTLTSTLTTSNVPLIEMSSGTVNVSDGTEISSTGDNPAITATGGTVNVADGTITSEKTSAISVGEGATLEIPTDSTAKITATNDNAVSFAAGAKAKLGERTITAGTNGATMDNDRNLLASAGTTTGEGEEASAGQVLVTATGEIYRAPANEPIEKTENGYELPENTIGPEGTLENGGQINGSDSSLTEYAKSITLDKNSVYLYSNTGAQTVQLTAKVDPASLADQIVWTSSDNSVATVDQTGLVTVVGDGTAEITATVGGQSATCTVNVSTYVYTGKYSYEVFTSVGDNGTISVDRYATEGDKVTIDVTPDEAYLLDALVVTANGKEVELTDNGDGTYTFTMPSADVKITATFAEDPDWTEPEPEEPSTDVSDIFIDVAPNAWYTAAIQYAYDNGLMTGVSANEFAPDATTTRGMIVSMLARLEGVESANDAGFADVEGEWYATAVNWAASVGVVSGYEDNTFRPNDAITREQLAAILMNYSAYKGEDVSARADLSAYTDQPSAWAEETMSWAVAEGLISGVTNTELQPQGQATRAQVAAILQRFLCK